MALAVNFSFGQQHQRCNHTELMDKIIRTDPTQVNAIEQARQITDQIVAEGKSSTSTVYEIPVVFHVIYNTSEQNISEQSIQSQLDVLNADYRKQNADASNVPSHFASVAGDMEINFCKASVDPDGNWTTGITRTQTSVSQWPGLSTQMMSAAQGGHDPWPHSDYLNIWVVNLDPIYLGFALTPGGSTNGMVIGYKNFGTIGSYLTNQYSLGRTATHEAGHWLDIFHPWGSGGSNPNCDQSDLVDDTPVQQESNYNCPSGIVTSCGNGPNGDMYMNFMDYVNDNCMVMFTNGQKARMRATLEGPRASILQSVGCNLNSIYESDLSHQISVYPNPSSGTIRLDHSPWIGNSVGLRILDLQGRPVKVFTEIRPSSIGLDLDISDLLSGVYLVEVAVENEKAIKRIILQ